MVTRFPGLAAWFETLTEEVRKGIVESTEALPSWARLPVIRRFVYGEIHKRVQETEPLIQRLVNVQRVREPLIGDYTKFIPGPRQALSATVTLIAPDGKVVVTRVAMPFGTKYNDADFRAMVTSSVYDRMFPGDIKATTKTMGSVIAIDWYVEEYEAL